MEDFHGLFQLLTRSSHCRRKDLLLPWRPQPRPPIHGANQTYYATHWCTRSRSTLWSPMVRSRQGNLNLFFFVITWKVWIFTLKPLLFCRTQWVGVKTIAVCHSLSGPKWQPNSFTNTTSTWSAEPTRWLRTATNFSPNVNSSLYFPRPIIVENSITREPWCLSMKHSCVPSKF